MAWTNAAKSDSVKEELLAPVNGPQVQGVMSPEQVKRLMEEDAGPAPWLAREGVQDGDARNFVTVPDEWVLRWLNPRLIDLMGWRDWKPVMASDPRVKVHVRSCIDPGNNIRRGGPHGGDVLAYMPKHWFEAKRAEHYKLTRMATQKAVDRQAQLKEEFARGKFGPNVHLDSAKHPTHTMGDFTGEKD